MEKTMMKVKLMTLALFAALPLQAKPRAARPGADALILKSLAGPATGYAAVERVQVFRAGVRPKALRVFITALPGGRMRREAFPVKRKGAPLIQVRDGRDQETPEKGLARLRSFYDLTVSTGGRVAKRKTWRVDLRLRDGTLRRSLWVDRDSGLLLKRETYRLDGSLARRERIVTLTLPAAVDAASWPAATSQASWAPDGFVLVGERDGVRSYSNGAESYAIARSGRGFTVTGDLAEDDAARVLASIEEAK